jgi:anti-anti-sigma factor
VDGNWSVVVEPTPEAPRLARHGLGEWLVERVPIRVRENALVVVTELVTNAVLFGRPPIEVQASLADDVLALEVADRGDSRPRRRVPVEGGGIGLNLVHFMADRVTIDADRSHVRCEFDATRAGALPTTWTAEPHALEVVREGATLRVVLHGDIDVAVSPELERMFAQLDASEVERLEIDLRDVAFVDTTGLRMAHRFDRWGRDNGVPVVFTRPSPAVMSSFETAGLAFRLKFADGP